MNFRAAARDCRPGLIFVAPELGKMDSQEYFIKQIRRSSIVGRLMKPEFRSVFGHIKQPSVYVMIAGGSGLAGGTFICNSKK